MPITATVTRGFTYATGVEVSSASLNRLGEPTVTIPSVTQTEVVMENFTVAGLPTNGTPGRIVYVTDGDGGNPCMAVDNGTDWVRVNLGSAVSSTEAEEYLIAD
jgi:hypothetical protein